MLACRWRARLFLAVSLLLLMMPSWAHNEQEDTTLEITIEGTQLSLAYLTKFPSMSSFVRLKQLDANGDQAYSDAEKQIFLERRLADYLRRTEVRLNDQRIELAAPTRELKVGSSLGLSELTVRYTLTGRLPARIQNRDQLFVKDPVFGWNRYKIASDHVGGTNVREDSAGDSMTVTFGSAEKGQATAGDSPSVSAEEDRLLALVSSEMTPTVLLGTLGLAFVLGALHALTPGHGKTMVAAYLVGSRGTVSQAIMLGIVVTITHTASVFLLGIACMVAFQYVVPDKVIPWLGFLSGLMVTGVGATLLLGRLAGKDWGHGHSHEHGGHSHGHSHSHGRAREGHSHSHSQPHSHSHSHSHSHQDGGQEHSLRHSLIAHPHAHVAREFNLQECEPVSVPVAREVRDAPVEQDAVSLWALVGLGISGGLVPCPEALVVLLAAISLNKLFLGMLVLVAFSAGLASLLVLIGILVVSATRMSRRYYPSDETITRVSMISYIFICGMGLVIAIRSLVAGGIITINL